MIDVYALSRWSDMVDLLCNRVAIVNQLHGCRYDHSPENPMRVNCRRGDYVVSYRDAEVASFSTYDFESLSSSLSVVGAWSSCVWQLSRAGVLRRDVV